MWIDQRVSHRPSRHRWLYNSRCTVHGRGEMIVRASLKAMVPMAYAIILAVFWVA